MEGHKDIMTADQDDPEILHLVAFSRDGQPIGSVSAYLPVVHVSEEAAELGAFDVIGSDGRLMDERHVMIDGTGTILQSMVIVPVRSLEIDKRGRRVTVPLTVAQLEAMPRRDPIRDATEPVLSGENAPR